MNHDTALQGFAGVPTVIPVGLGGVESGWTFSPARAVRNGSSDADRLSLHSGKHSQGWAKRQSPAEFKRFLQMAIGSCEEMKVWLDFSKDEKYITDKQHESLQAEYAKVGALLQRLWKGWKKL